MEGTNWVQVITAIVSSSFIAAVVSGVFNNRNNKLNRRQASASAAFLAAYTLEQYALAQPPYLEALAEYEEALRHQLPRDEDMPVEVPLLNFPDSIKWETMDADIMERVRSVEARYTAYERDLDDDLRADEEGMELDGHIDLAYDYTKEIAVEAWLAAGFIRKKFHWPALPIRAKDRKAIDEMIDSLEKAKFRSDEASRQRQLRDEARLAERLSAQKVAT